MSYQLKWSDEHLALLGKIDDKALAKIKGCHAKTVRRERRARGIPPASRDLDLGPDVIADLGRMSDQAVVAKHALAITPCGLAIRRQRLEIPSFVDASTKLLTPAQIELLGTDTDAAIAERLGVCARLVWRTRRDLGIASAHKRSTHLGFRRWEHEEDALLGTDSDAAIAERIERSTIAVTSRRIKFGIPSVNEHRRRLRQTTAPPPCPA